MMRRSLEWSCGKISLKLALKMTRNTGNGFDQKNSEYIIIRYMDSGFFVSGDGSLREPWQEIAYRRIKAYNYDVNATGARRWAERYK